MFMSLLTDYNLTILISKLTDVTVSIVDILVLIIGFIGMYNSKKIIYKILTVVAIVLLIINIFFVFHGGFSEKVIEEFGEKLYIGQVENGQANGWGRLFNEERSIEYIGEFRNNKFDGNGKLYDIIVENNTKTTFCKYEGGFSEGNFSGYGRYYIYNNGKELVEYEGTFLKNEKCGQGIFYWYDDNNSVNKKYDGHLLTINLLVMVCMKNMKKIISTKEHL